MKNRRAYVHSLCKNGIPCALVRYLQFACHIIQHCGPSHAERHTCLCLCRRIGYYLYDDWTLPLWKLAYDDEPGRT